MGESLTIQVPDELFAPAESSAFEGVWELPLLAAGPDEYRFDAPLAWRVDVTNTGEALLVAGEVGGRARGTCSRCLEEFEIDLAGEVEGYFLIEEGAEPPEDLDGDEFQTLGRDHVIDLEPLLSAGLLLELPLKPLCSPECKGLCFTCGANLNEGPCGCDRRDADADAEAAAGANNPFAVLKDFPFEQ